MQPAGNEGKSSTANCGASAFLSSAWPASVLPGETWQVELINETPPEEGIAIRQEKVFHREASAALGQVVGSPSLVVPRARLRKATAM